MAGMGFREGLIIFFLFGVSGFRFWFMGWLLAPEF